jgi:hypothetical protein
MSNNKARCFILLTGVLLLAAALVFTLWYKLYREVEQAPFASAEEAFRYGSIGSERYDGVPYLIWRVLPKIFPDYLPRLGGYAALGLPWEPGKETPVGFSVKTVGFPRIAFNCAFCHSGSYRVNEQDMPTIVTPGTGNTADTLGYVRFLSAAARDAKFNASDLLREMAYLADLSVVDKLIYRFLIIPQTKKALIHLGEQYAWANVVTRWGHGRIDPFNPIKYGILGMGLDHSVGNSDMMPLWNLKAHKGMAYHWDGLNTDLHEVVLSSAVGDGMRYEEQPVQRLAEIEEYIQNVPPPTSPFATKDVKSPYYVNPEQAAQGKALFDKHCSACHVPGGQQFGQVVPVEQVGTDRHRVEMWTDEAAKRYNAYGKWGFSHFQNKEGYVGVMLDGLWMRAPYLHNGSVPSLRDLLNAPESRSKTFFRGYDLYDPVNVGFVTQGPRAEEMGSLVDTTQPGNGNLGHLYGTDLSEAEKQDLLTYLKTL